MPAIKGNCWRLSNVKNIQIFVKIAEIKTSSVMQKKKNVLMHKLVQETMHLLRVSPLMLKYFMHMEIKIYSDGTIANIYVCYFVAVKDVERCIINFVSTSFCWQRKGNGRFDKFLVQFEDWILLQVFNC
jgi:hypothetical protein